MSERTAKAPLPVWLHNISLDTILTPHYKAAQANLIPQKVICHINPGEAQNSGEFQNLSVANIVGVFTVGDCRQSRFYYTSRSFFIERALSR